VPPLRERKEDIALLANEFLKRAERRHGMQLGGLSDAAVEEMLRYPWPGNVRELQNCIERAVILIDEGKKIEPSDLGLVPSAPRGSMVAISAPDLQVEGIVELPKYDTLVPMVPAPSAPASNGGSLALEDLERHHILNVLRQTNGNRTQAANLLKISIRTLRNKLNEYKAAGLIEGEDDEEAEAS